MWTSVDIFAKNMATWIFFRNR